MIFFFFLSLDLSRSHGFSYFYQFQPSTMDPLEMKLNDFLLFFIKVLWSHYSNHEFKKLVWVDFDYLIFCFFLIIFLFHHLTLGVLQIEFHIFSYRVI